MKKLIASIKFGDSSLVIDDTTSTISFGALDRGNISDLTNWGCFSNTGDIEFFDADNQFKSIIASYPNAKVEISYLSRNTTKLLATFFIDDYDYADESKKVSLTLKDVLIDWQDRKLNKYLTFYAKPIISIWLGHLLYSNMKATDAATAKMQDTLIATSYMSESTRWAGIDKLCQATMLRCFCDFDGRPLLSDETPKQLNNIVIRSKNILSIGNRIKKSKTKINNASISVKKLTKHINEAIAPEVPFTWFNISGVNEGQGNIMSVSFNAYNANGITLLDNKLGAYFGTSIKKPEHLHDIGEADITVNIAETSTSNPKIVRTVKTTNPQKADEEGYGTYVPSGLSVKESTTNTNNYIVAFTDESVFSTDGRYYVEGGSVTILGNFMTDDGDEVIGLADGLDIPSNELIQTDSTYNGKSLGQHILDTIQEKYGNGVECVEIEVTPSDYYDINGVPIIDTNGTKPLFEKYDIVTPYVMRNGFEQPYSTNDDGTPKSFKVMGIEYNYSGFLRQKLHLQENV
jgi:hypothetical protein